MTKFERPEEVARDPELLRAPGVDRELAPPGRTPLVAHDADTDANPERRDERADIGMYVSLVAFPATSEELIAGATANNAPDHVLDRLQGLRRGASFGSTRELWIALDLEASGRF